MKHYKNLLFLTVLIYFAALTFVSGATSQGMRFSGSVFVNGAPANDGLSVGIKVDDILVALTTTKNGKFGLEPSVIVYDPSGDRAGKQVKILINDKVVIDNLIYADGSSVEKNLRVSINPKGQVLGVSTYKFNRNLGITSRGQDVTELQNRLTIEGLYAGPVTGYFGPLTSKAVKVYQKNNNLPIVGMVGPKTRVALNSY
jgi:hypothetical protein